MKDSLIRLLGLTILEIKKSDYDDRVARVLNRLVYQHDKHFMINTDLENIIQQESRFWTGEDEEKYNSLKLLRMKSFENKT